MLENLGKLNTGTFIVNNLRLVGVVEAVFVFLFLIPSTMHIDFFLLLSWFGGAIMIHVASEDKPIPPIIFLIVAWVSAYLRDPSLFGF
ncbi:MAG: hypothetical protein M0Q26_08825 [Chitinophagaceae bacterium]|nr:hypothetical protein [Chitinophagaceae bacterium]MDP1810785.1 hypothetical protein [Sediminibacterium sp.]MDP3667465.1 hypothetical protein [Sediminibacterium sp.]